MSFMTNPALFIAQTLLPHAKKKRRSAVELIAQMAQSSLPESSGRFDDSTAQRFFLRATRESFRIYGVNHHLFHYNSDPVISFPACCSVSRPDTKKSHLMWLLALETHPTPIWLCVFSAIHLKLLCVSFYLRQQPRERERNSEVANNKVFNEI